MAYGCQTPSAQRRSDQFPLTPMGVLAPGSAHARPSAQPPIDMSGNFRRMCLQSHLQTSPPTPQKAYPKFWNPRKLPPLSAQKCHSAGSRGGPQFLVVDLNPMTTFENTPLCPPKYSIVQGGGPRLFLGCGILIFLLLRASCQVSEP